GRTRAGLTPEREEDGLCGRRGGELDRVVAPVARPRRERRRRGEGFSLSRRTHLDERKAAGHEFFCPGREAQAVSRTRLDEDELRDRRGRRFGASVEIYAEAARALSRRVGVER